MAELLTIALAANEQTQYRKAGQYLEIIDSAYALGISLYTDTGSQTDTINGAQSGFFLNTRFGALDVRNGAVAQTVQILLLDAGESGGTRRQPGVVQVVDGERIKVQGGTCFSAVQIQAGAVGRLYGV